MRTIMAVIAVAVALVLIVGIPQGNAGMINYDRLQKQEGAQKTSPVKTPLWAKQLPRVTNAVERRYDINRDRKLQTAETKIFLRDVIAEVDTKGGYTINSDILKEYDRNRDGVISLSEVDVIVRDAGRR